MPSINEIAVVFRPVTKGQAVAQEAEAGYDPDLASTEGTIQGSTFHFETAHFEWVYKLAGQLGLRFSEVGKRRHGSKATLFFCDELEEYYFEANVDEDAFIQHGNEMLNGKNHES